MAEASWVLSAAYGAGLLGIHVAATRGSGKLPRCLNRRWGASAGTVGSRWSAQFTAPWLHESWFHMGYNLTVLMATMPVALCALGPAALGLAWGASPLAGFGVNLLILLPAARRGWRYARRAVEPRLVGASVVIFAGAGMAVAATLSAPWQAAVVLAFLAYETVLAKAGFTQPFVGFYHVGGFVIGLATGWIMDAPGPI